VWLGTTGRHVPRQTPSSGENKPTDRSPERPRLGVLLLSDHASGCAERCDATTPRRRPALPRRPRAGQRIDGRRARWQSKGISWHFHAPLYPLSPWASRWLSPPRGSDFSATGFFELAEWAL